MSIIDIQIPVMEAGITNKNGRNYSAELLPDISEIESIVPRVTHANTIFDIPKEGEPGEICIVDNDSVSKEVKEKRLYSAILEILAEHSTTPEKRRKLYNTANYIINGEYDIYIYVDGKGFINYTGYEEEMESESIDNMINNVEGFKDYDKYRPDKDSGS